MKRLAVIALALVACERGHKPAPQRDAAPAAAPTTPPIDAAPTGPPVVWRFRDPAILIEGALPLANGGAAVFGHLLHTATVAGTRIEGPAALDEVSVVVVLAANGTPTAVFPIRMRQSKIFGAAAAGDELLVAITGVDALAIAGKTIPPDGSWVSAVVTFDPVAGPRAAFPIERDAWPSTFNFSDDAILRMPDGDVVVSGRLDQDDPVTRYAADGKRRWQHTVPALHATAVQGDAVVIAYEDDKGVGIGVLDAKGRIQRRCRFSALLGTVWEVEVVGDELVGLGSAQFSDGTDLEHDLAYALPCVAPERPRQDLLPGKAALLAGSGVAAGHLLAMFLANDLDTKAEATYVVIDPTAGHPRVISLGDELRAWLAQVTPDGDVLLVGTCGVDRTTCVERVDLGL